jgi:hypothetical protein
LIPDVYDGRSEFFNFVFDLQLACRVILSLSNLLYLLSTSHIVIDKFFQITQQPVGSQLVIIIVVVEARLSFITLTLEIYSLFGHIVRFFEIF